MEFTVALKECLKGKLIKRKGWNGKNQYVFNFKNSVICIKQEIYHDLGSNSNFENTTINNYPINDFLMIKTNDNKVNSWTPSIIDILSNDWEVKEV